MKVGIAQLNPCVGDLEGNVAACVAAAEQAAAEGADLVVFPELVISGYPPRDILLDDGFVDAALAATDDLARRDFTIDAMAIALDDVTDKVLDADKIIDPFNGRDDLENGIVRTVNQTCFPSDAARLLRCVRLAAELEFTIDDDTSRLIRDDSHLIASVACERTREELLRLLALPKAGSWLAYLDDAGLLTALIPELEMSRGVDQP